MNARPLLVVALPLVLVANLASAQTAKPVVKPTVSSAACATILKAKVNLNTASVNELRCLPGVTGALAKDLVINRPFKSARDVQTKIEIVGRQLWIKIGRYSTF